MAGKVLATSMILPFDRHLCEVECSFHFIYIMQNDYLLNKLVLFSCTCSYNCYFVVNSDIF